MKNTTKKLLILPIVFVLLAAGIFLPDAVFSFFDQRELTSTAQKTMDAVDLQLSSENNLYRRMQMLSEPPTMVQTGENLTTRTRQDINYEVQYFIENSQLCALTNEEFINTSRIDPVLYTNTDMQLSAVFWEVEVLLGENGDYRLYLVVDDVSKIIIGLRFDVVIDPRPYSSLDGSQFHRIMTTLRRNFEWSKTALVENRDEYVTLKNRWYGSTCYYIQSTLHIRDEGKQYRYLCCGEKNSFIFNLPEGRERKEYWNLKFRLEDVNSDAETDDSYIYD